MQAFCRVTLDLPICSLRKSEKELLGVGGILVYVWCFVSGEYILMGKYVLNMHKALNSLPISYKINNILVGMVL